MKETNLKLNKEQEEKLLTYVKDRLKQLQVDNSERHKADKLSWDIYENSREDRLQPDTIYSHSNLPVPLTSLVVDHFLARAEDEITPPLISSSKRKGRPIYNRLRISTATFNGSLRSRGPCESAWKKPTCMFSCNEPAY